jgi:hypothetical protein
MRRRCGASRRRGGLGGNGCAGSLAGVHQAAHAADELRHAHRSLHAAYAAVSARRTSRAGGLAAACKPTHRILLLRARAARR